MADLDTGNLERSISDKITPFFNDILSKSIKNIHSLYVTGSALTSDYDRKTSDINSIVVLKDMDLAFLEILAPLGKKYRKNGVAAPLIMTPDYIEQSLDAFPIEFLNFRLIHESVFGEDIIKDVDIKRNDLRHQCEREVKSKLISLRQGYLSAMGDRRLLTENIVLSFTGYMPLFRSIIYLMNEEPPKEQRDVVKMLVSSVELDTDIFEKILNLKRKRFKPSKDQLDTLFEDYYAAAEKIGNIVNDIKT